MVDPETNTKRSKMRLTAPRFRLFSLVALLPCLATIAESYNGGGGLMQTRGGTSLAANGKFALPSFFPSLIPGLANRRRNEHALDAVLEPVTDQRGSVSFPYLSRNNNNTKLESLQKTAGTSKKTIEQKVLENYEFSQQQSKQIKGIADIMLFLGYQGLFFGWIKLGLGIFFISFKRKPAQFLAKDAFEVAGQLAEMYISKLLRDGGLSFKRIVERDGSDIDDLFSGLDSFQRIMNQHKKPTLIKWVAVVGALLSMSGVFPKNFPGISTFYNAI
jgi:hypothetical protein